ncbi:hypothetical protein MMC28_003087 [Mycoblastus sanguinarius]|nr:hypothetical protein [Mycoblastus sanguinarius]
MRSTSSKAVKTVLTLSCAFAFVLAQDSPGLKPLVYEGCFTSSTGMTDLGSFTFQSPGYCQQQCVNANKAVMGTTKGSNCWCGDLLPDPSSKVSDSQCSSSCNGYNQDMCGGPNAWSVQLTGLSNNVGSESDSTTTSSIASAAATSSTSNPLPSPTQKGPPSVVTKASTIVVTAPGQTEAQETVITTTHTPPSSGPNKAGIAAGVIVGIVALSAIAGVVFFILRSRKRRAVEEEYRRNVASDFSAKPPTSSAGSMSDSRLEPSVMMQRRQSDGSIADNQDYSRRILKITNPDGS